MVREQQKQSFENIVFPKNVPKKVEKKKRVSMKKKLIRS